MSLTDTNDHDRSVRDVAELVGTSIATQESVAAAFAVLALHPDDPWQACLTAASLDGDSDTIAAMTGAIAGPCHGMDSWPQDAVDTVRKINNLDWRCSPASCWRCALAHDSQCALSLSKGARAGGLRGSPPAWNVSAGLGV